MFLVGPGDLDNENDTADNYSASLRIYVPECACVNREWLRMDGWEILSSAKR